MVIYKMVWQGDCGLQFQLSATLVHGWILYQVSLPPFLCVVTLCSCLLGTSKWDDAVGAGREEKKQSGPETAANLSAQPNPVPH